MRIFREVKAWYYPLILFLVLFFICLLSCHNYNEILDTRRLLNAHELDNQTFAGVLEGASMPDRTIILSIVNKEQASPGSIIDLFLESFKVGIGTKHFLNHLVIVATDSQAFQYCKSVHRHCFHYAPVRTVFQTDKLSKNPNHLVLSRIRLDVLRQVLDLGYSFFYTDADVMWLRNPFKYVNPMKEMTFSCEVFTDEDSSKVDVGLFYLQAAELSYEFFKYWKLARIIYPNSPDYYIFRELIDLEILTEVRSKTNLISTVHYGGFCQPSNDLSKISTWHANCCNSIEDKVHDLNLIMDDWKIYTSSRSSSVSWSSRAPFRCRS